MASSWLIARLVGFIDNIPELVNVTHISGDPCSYYYYYYYCYRLYCWTLMFLEGNVSSPLKTGGWWVGVHCF